LRGSPCTGACFQYANPSLRITFWEAPFVGVDDPKDFPCVVMAGHVEESEARLRGVAPTASRGNESVAPLQPAAAVALDPVDACVADDDPGASLDDRLLREGELYAPCEHAVEALVRLVGRQPAAGEGHEGVVAEELDEPGPVTLGGTADLEPWCQRAGVQLQHRTMMPRSSSHSRSHSAAPKRRERDALRHLEASFVVLVARSGTSRTAPTGARSVDMARFTDEPTEISGRKACGRVDDNNVVLWASGGRSL
jgi:hypothetical protein